MNENTVGEHIANSEEDLKIAQRNLTAYQAENESLKRENENLRGIIYKHEEQRIWFEVRN